MKLAIARTPLGDRIHIVPQSMFADDPDAFGATESTACGIALDNLDSPELGEHQDVYVSVPALTSPFFCPNCKRQYEYERECLNAWNERVMSK